MNDKFKYKEGDRIYFNMGENMPSGWAKIKGCSSDPIPPLGRQWIVELEEPSNIDKTVYPFSCIRIFDIIIKDTPDIIRND